MNVAASSPVTSPPDLLAQIVAVSADAIFSEDMHGRITSWNAAAEQLYGCDAQHVMGRSAADVLPKETAAQLQTVRERALAGERIDRFDTWHVRHDGRRVAVSLTVSPLHESDGTMAGLAASVQDVSVRMQLSADLETAREVLERQYELLGRSNRDLEQFAYVASHDLSEPLRTMTGFVQLLERRYADSFDERGSRYLFHVVDGAARMRTLIEDLLEYSRFLRVEESEDLIDTQAVVRRALAGLDVTGVEVGALPKVWCDEQAVLAVFQNLISNALKFHRHDVPARVTVAGRLQGERVLFLVDDNGIGIAPQDRTRVFGMFSRLHARDAYPGTGIGLAIVQQIAERSGGSVWAEPSPLGGTRMCITMPTKPPAGKSTGQ